MFGRRRHAAATPAMPAPQLSDEAVFDAVHRTLAEYLGAEGSWSVVRRSPDDRDTIFRDVLTHSVATDVVAALREARTRLTGDPEAERVAAEADAHGLDDRAAAFPEVTTETNRTTASADEQAHGQRTAAEPAAWTPAPITVWADLRKPVTGEVPVPRRDDLVA